MKKYLGASGLVGTALLAAITVAGCSAETGTPQEGANVGSTQQAVTVTPALTVNTGANASSYFGATLRLDSSILNSAGHADNLELWLGGFASAGGGQTVIQYYDRESHTLYPLKDTANTNNNLVLPTGVGEVEVIQVPGQTLAYLIVTGRATRDSTASANTYILTIALDGSNKIASGTLQKIGDTGTNGTAMATGSVFGYKNLKQCGSSKVIGFGGATNKGFFDTSSVTATDRIAVFTYNSGHSGGDSTWDVLKDTGGTEVKLSSARAYPEVFDVDATNHLTFYIPGGMTGSATAVADVDKLVVNSSCQATNASNHKTPLITNSMPGARARMDSIAVSATISGVVYDFVLAGGNDTTTTRPRDAYLFDVGTESWTTMTNAIQVGEVFPHFNLQPGASSVKLVTGIKPDTSNPPSSLSSNPYNDTSVTVDVLQFSSSPASWSAGTSLTTDRFGAFTDSLKNGSGATWTDYVGLGAQHTNTNGNPPTLTGYPGDIESM